MSRIFITGSTDGLGYAAARDLIEDGHEVLLHARSRSRAYDLGDLASQSAGVVIGDLSSAAETHKVAEQVNRIGRMDAVIQNAGIYRVPNRSVTCRRSLKNSRGECAGDIHPYCTDQASSPPDLSQQRHASQREFFARRRGLAEANVGSDPCLL